MARDYQINGATMVSVKGRSDSLIGSLTQLGLPFSPIRVSPTFAQKPITLDAWGGIVPNEIQAMLAAVTITMDLIHFDRTVIDLCMIESMGGAPAIGSTAAAGVRLGNNLPRFAASTTADANGIIRSGNHFIGLNLSSPVGLKPWRFYSAYLTGSPIEFPLGTEKSVVQMVWQAIAYTPDPWNGGLGAAGAIIWDHVLDT